MPRHCTVGDFCWALADHDLGVAERCDAVDNLVGDLLGQRLATGPIISSPWRGARRLRLRGAQAVSVQPSLM